MATQKCVAIFVSIRTNDCTHSMRCHGGVTAAFRPRQPEGAGSIPVRGSSKTNDRTRNAQPILTRTDDARTCPVVKTGGPPAGLVASQKALIRSQHQIAFNSRPFETISVHFELTSLSQAKTPANTFREKWRHRMVSPLSFPHYQSFAHIPHGAMVV